MVGIKGVGMTSLALIYKKMGNTVWGCDVEEIFTTDEVLKKNGIRVLNGFHAWNISSDIDMVVTTGAHKGLMNPEIIEAKKRAIPVSTHAEALGTLMESFKTKISVCGTHGKTTTSALLSFIFKKLDLKIGYLVGVSNFSGFPGGGYTGRDFFIAEADEYLASPGVDNTPRFLYQNPNYIICTNVDFDHPDAFKNLNEVKNSFSAFFKKISGKKNSALIYCRDDDNLTSILKKESFQGYSYGFSKKADLQIYDIKIKENRTYFKIKFKKEKLGIFNLAQGGKHNVLNASAAILLLRLLKFDLKKVGKLISEFTGALRRFELIFKYLDTYLFDDYAHHPTELVQTLLGARLLYPGKRIILIFQPHTYSRTKVLADEFITSICEADKAFLLDIFTSAREKKSSENITSEEIVQNAQKKGYKNIIYASSGDLADFLAREIRAGDLILTAGAGDIYRRHNDIIRLIKRL